MVDVTQSFLDEIAKPNQHATIRGTLTSKGVVTELTAADFVSGSISRVTKAVSSTNFQIGEVHIDYLNFSLGIRDNTFPNLIGSTVNLEFGIELAKDVYEWCSLGTYIINANGVVRKNMTIAVTADSMLSKTDKTITVISTAKPYDLAKWACEKCGLELATTEESFKTFPNGNIEVSLPNPNTHEGIETYRDLLMWLACWTCTFVTCDIDGKVLFKPFRGVSKWTLNPDTVFSKQFNDYEMDIQNVTMLIDGVDYELVPDTPQENTLPLDSNPFFLTYKADGLRKSALTAIRDELQGIKYVPYKIVGRGNPALEVGDWFTYQGKDYLITSSTFHFRGKCTLQGVGLTIGNTKKQGTTSKGGGGGGGSSGGSGTGGEPQFRTIRYTNVKEISIGSSRQKALEFVFELGADVVPILTVIVNCNINSSGFISLVLKYDNVDIFPIYNEYVHEGEQSFSFTFPLAPRDVPMTHALYGYIYSKDNVTGTVAVENVIASVSGWGIASGIAEWDGTLTFEEKVPLFKLGMNGMHMLDVEETLDITLQEPSPVGFSQNVDRIGLSMRGINMLGFSESISFGEFTPPEELILTATQAVLSGATQLRSNSSAEDGYDLDYLGYYDDGDTATWSLTLPSDAKVDLNIEATCNEDRYLAVYIDDVLVNSSLTFNSGSWEASTLKNAIRGYQLSAGSHTVTVAKASGSYAPIVDFMKITYVI